MIQPNFDNIGAAISEMWLGLAASLNFFMYKGRREHLLSIRDGRGFGLVPLLFFV